MSVNTATWVSQVPYQDMTEERFNNLSDLEKSYYLRGYTLPTNSASKKVYIAYVDGGCYNNGKIDSEAYGSYKIYDVTNLVYKGIIPSNIHQMTQDYRFTPTEENMRFPLAISDATRATNNYAEAASMQMVLMAGIQGEFLSTESHLFIFSDSELIINQLKGIYAVKNSQLAKVYKMIHTIFDKYSAKNNSSVWTNFNLEKIPGTLMKKILGH